MLYAGRKLPSEEKNARVYKGSLNACLKQIARQLNLNADALQRQAAHAPYADLARWTGGSGSKEERRILYAIARVVQPVSLVELGVSWGGSTTQFLAALKRNKKGYCMAVDNRAKVTDRHDTGTKIPKELRKRLRLRIRDAVHFLHEFDESIDLLYEDCAHDYQGTLDIYKLAIPMIAPNGILISHDAVIKPDVARAILDSGIEPVIYLTTNSACGLAIWQKQ